MPEMNIQMLFEHAISWETRARDLFADFANLFSHEPKVSSFWIQLSKDESGHIGVLRDILGKMPTAKRLMTVSNEQWNSVTQVEELINEASRRKVLTLDDAYELAHQIETSEVNALFKMLVTDYLPDEKGHKFILSEVTEHIEKLMRFGKKYTQSHRRLINARSI
jgi:rubrerythrin